MLTHMAKVEATKSSKANDKEMEDSKNHHKNSEIYKIL